jgi:uncharacterized protein (TIGR02996 family)
MTHNDAFVHEIIESPDDDTLRLVYADWLEEHGEPPPAELIRTQCALARLPNGDPQRSRHAAANGLRRSSSLT